MKKRVKYFPELRLYVVSLEAFLKTRYPNQIESPLDRAILDFLFNSDAPKSIPEITRAHGLQERRIRIHVTKLLAQGDIERAAKISTGMVGRTAERFTVSKRIRETVAKKGKEKTLLIEATMCLS